MKVLVFLLVVWGARSAQAVALPNGHFEQVSPSGKLTGWEVLDRATSVAGDRTEPHGGKISARLSVSIPRQVVGIRSDWVSVGSEGVYDLRGSARFAAGSSRRALLRVQWMDAERNAMDWAIGTSSWSMGSDAWITLAGTVVAPPGARYARVICLAEDWGESFEPFDVCFDDITFVALSVATPARVVVTARSFSEKRKTRVKIAVLDSAGSALKQDVVVTLSATNARAPRWLPCKGGTVEFSLDAEPGPPGGATLSAQCGDAFGQIVLGDVLAGRIVGRISDADTRRDIAASVVVQDADGQILLRRPFEGAYEVFVPPGQWWVSAQSGPTRVSPELQAVDLAAGDSASVMLPIRSWVNLRARGWLAGDLNVRGASGMLYRTVLASEVALSARAAGLDWALLTDYWDSTLRHYRPEDIGLQSDSFAGAFGRYFKAPTGELWMLGDAAQQMRDASPARFATHQGRGIIGHTGPVTSERSTSGIVFDVVSGQALDCLDLMGEKADDDKAQRLWFDLLNHGYRVAATASSQAVLDKDSDISPGRFRTYFHLDGEPTPDRIGQALARGNSFISSGPLLLFSVFAAGPGSDLPVGRKRRVSFSAWSDGRPDEYLTRVELIRNGEIAQTWPLENHPRAQRLSATLEDSVDCWYIAKCYGSSATQVAITNPIYFRSADFQPPEPLQAIVQGSIQTRAGQPIDEARVFVRDPLGSVILETVAQKGAFRLWVPSTSTLDVTAKGYASVQARIADSPGIVSLLADMQSRAAPDSLSFGARIDRITEVLQNLDLTFVLQAK